MKDEKKKDLGEQIIEESIDSILAERFGRYSKYIIQNRALPDVRDGLKPVQRRILFAMHELNLMPHLAFKKSARVVGEVIGKYHPHGDSSIYEAMVRMAQEWKMLMPLVDMHGNKGSIDDDPAAAMRYTEVKLTSLAATMLDLLRKNTIKFVPNFDDSEQEPLVLPTLFPNLLVNGARGIAAGYATEMPPHNLNEIVNAIIYKIEHPEAGVNELMKLVKGPDFPTGGLILGVDGIKKALSTGSGRFSILSKYEITKSAKGNHQLINITEIPYGVIKQKLVKDMDEIRFNSNLDGIREIRDESDRDGISIVIELESSANAEMIINYLFQKTELQIYYSYNNVAIANHAPRQLNLLDMIDAYLSFQHEVQTKALQFDLERNQTRYEIVLGFIRVAMMIDKVISVIRKAEGSKQGVIEALKSNFDFTSLQAEAIAELRLYRLSSTDQTLYEAEAQELLANIKRLEVLLNSKEAFNAYLIGLLNELKTKFGKPRQTTIKVHEAPKLEVNLDELIKHETIMLGISKGGYLKRVSLRASEANELATYALKDDDALVYLNQVHTASKLLIITSLGQYVFLPIHLIGESKWRDFGKHINDFALISPRSTIISVIPVADFALNAFVVLVTKSGIIKRVAIKDFEVTRFSKPLQAFKISEHDSLAGAALTNGFLKLLLLTRQGKVLKLDEKDVPVYSLRTSGVKALNLVDDEIVALAAGRESDQLGLISDQGSRKRVRINHFATQKRLNQPRNLFRASRSVKHEVIEAKVVDSNTALICVNENHEMVQQTFGDVNPSGPDEGWVSLKGATFSQGLILNFPEVNLTNTYLFNRDKALEAERFAAAEATIAKTSQVSIDDILKKL